MAHDERKIESGRDADVEAHAFTPLGPSADERPATRAETGDAKIEAHRLHGLERQREREDES